MILLATVSMALAAAVPLFKGFGDSRYQMHDAVIVKCVREFNRHRGAWADANRDQARQIPDLTEELVKAHMIQETGGNDSRSVASWKVDPLQINVPGDWSEEKGLLGLKKPLHRNEGQREANIRAAIKYLVRKGFSSSGKPVRVLRDAEFIDWYTALKRYNGRGVMTIEGRQYCDEYAERVIERAVSPGKLVPIRIDVRSSRGHLRGR